MTTLAWPTLPILPSNYLAMSIRHRGNHNALPHDQVAPFFAGYVALVQQHPNHLHDDVVFERNQNITKRLSPIQAVCALGYTPLGKPRAQWPQTLEELLKDPPTQDKHVNGEWVAALLLASGADPWTTYTSHSDGQTFVFDYPPCHIHGGQWVVGNFEKCFTPPQCVVHPSNRRFAL